MVCLIHFAFARQHAGMAATIPDVPPSSLRAGDSAHWTRSFADYPASAGWALAYTLVGTSGLHSFSATTSGDAFAVDITASTTAAWVAGRYTLVEYLTKGTDRVTVGAATLLLLADLAAVPSATDTRSHAAKVLDKINAWLETGNVISGEFQIADRRIRQYGIAELLALRDRYAAIVASEDAGKSGAVRRMLVQL